MAMNPVIAAALGIDPNGLAGGYNYSAGGNANFSGINALDLIRQYQADQSLPSYNGDGEAGLSAMQARQANHFGNGQNGPGSWGYNGYDVIPLPNGGYGIAKGTPGAPNGTGWGTYGEQPMDVYDPSGKFMGSGITPKGLNPNDESGKQFAIGAMFMAPMALAAMGALGGAAGSGAGGAGGAGTAASFGGQSLGGIGGGLEGTALGNAAGVGSASAFGAGAIDPALAAGLGGSALGAAGGAAGAASGAGGIGGAGGATASTSGLLSGLGGGSNLLGLGATALGGLLGSQGVKNEQTQASKMDPRLDPYIYGSLFPQAQSTLNSQLPIAQQNAAALNGVGTGLLQTQVNPNEAQNPYLTGIADDMSRRTQQLLDQNNLAIQGNSVAAGGLGGSRQGVAQGVAAGQAADSLQGQLSNLYYGAYNSDANRNLQKIALGSGLMDQGQQMAWNPLNYASNVYKPYTGLNSSITTGTQQGGGAMGVLGGLLGGAQFAKNTGLFGNTSGGLW